MGKLWERKVVRGAVELTVILGAGYEEKVDTHHSHITKTLVGVTHSVECYFGSSHNH